MKENNDIDKLLRASLDSYKPAPNAPGKKKFLEEAAGILPGKRRPGAWWKPVLIAVIIVGITGSLVWYLASVHNTESPAENVENEANAVISQNISISEKTETQITEQSISEKESETEITREKGTSIKENLKTTIATDEIQSKQIVAAAKAKSLPDSTQYPIFSTQNPTPNTQYPIPNNTSADSAQYPTTNNNAKDSTAKTDISQADTIIAPAELKEQPQKGGLVFYSAFYQPELVFNTGEGNKMANSFGFEFQFRPFHPKYVIRTGLGISLSPGEYNYGIDYYEYMGSYLHLDSVTFTLAEDNFHLLPSYHQTEREVYDSEVQTQYTSTDKRFAYLYIPVMLGYDFIRKDHFTFGLRAGPSVSLLLNKKASQPQYNLGENQLVGVNQITPEREVMNWQVSGGLNLTFIGKNNYFIEAEPSFNYFFNQVSGEDGSKRHPYSVGFRIAVGIVPERRNE